MNKNAETVGCNPERYVYDNSYRRFVDAAAELVKAAIAAATAR